MQEERGDVEVGSKQSEGDIKTSELILNECINCDH